MKKKIRSWGLPSKKTVRISATYRTISVVVPDAPVSEHCNKIICLKHREGVSLNEEG
jgi:hypothetical protein